jgi:hypothetical protein
MGGIDEELREVLSGKVKTFVKAAAPAPHRSHVIDHSTEGDVGGAPSLAVEPT